MSYNDLSINQIKQPINNHLNDISSSIIKEILKESNYNEKYRNHPNLLSKRIKELQNKYEINKNIIEVSMAQQYLKMVCSCIYKKVDETDEDKREQAYKSFHILALYLEKKGITGIIYPCTRTNKIIGKNLVLFNKYDAEPIESSIRRFDYK